MPMPEAVYHAYAQIVKTDQLNRTDLQGTQSPEIYKRLTSYSGILWGLVS